VVRRRDNVGHLLFFLHREGDRRYALLRVSIELVGDAAPVSAVPLGPRGIRPERGFLLSAHRTSVVGLAHDNRAIRYLTKNRGVAGSTSASARTMRTAVNSGCASSAR